MNNKEIQDLISKLAEILNSKPNETRLEYLDNLHEKLIFCKNCGTNYTPPNICCYCNYDD